MMYQTQEVLHAAWAPWRLVAATIAQFSAPPYLMGCPAYSRSVAAGAELFERATRHWSKPDFGLETTNLDGVEVDVTQDPVLAMPFCTLVRFRKAVPATQPRVLLVAPLSGHYGTLLRGTVEALLPGHDVYLTDWTNARDVPLDVGRFDLDDYIDYVIRFLRFLGPDTHVIAVCQPGVPVLAAVSLMSAEEDAAVPRSLTLMGGPIDTRESPTAVNLLATGHSLRWFEENMVDTVPAGYLGAGRLVRPGFLQLAAFLAMNPDRHLSAHFKLFDDILRGDDETADAHRRFYDEYFSVMDLTAQFYLQTVQTVFQDYDLPLGRMTSRGRPVEPAAITRTALMTIEGERDDITGLGQTRAAHRLCTGIPEQDRCHYEQQGAGHFGIFSGHRWRSEVMPRIRDFILAHNG